MLEHEHVFVSELDGSVGEFLDHMAEMHNYASDAYDMGSILKDSRAKHRSDHESESRKDLPL